MYVQVFPNQSRLQNINAATCRRCRHPLILRIALVEVGQHTMWGPILAVTFADRARVGMRRSLEDVSSRRYRKGMGCTGCRAWDTDYLDECTNGG